MSNETARKARLMAAWFKANAAGDRVRCDAIAYAHQRLEYGFKITGDAILASGSRRYFLDFDDDTIEVFATNGLDPFAATQIITISDHPVTVITGHFLSDTDALAAWVAKYREEHKS